MSVLWTLTLLWAVVLVVAVAASLIAILVSLRRIARALGEVREALAQVRDRTRPLTGHLEALHAAASGESRAEPRNRAA